MRKAYTIDKLNEEAAFSLMLYSSEGSATRGRNVLRQNMISIVLSGEKEIFFDQKPLYITPGRILLLAAGNYLHTERRPESGCFTSIIIFFDSSLLSGLLKGNEGILDAEPISHALIPRDEYLNGYSTLLQQLLASGKEVSTQLEEIKIKELLLYLLAIDPGAIKGLLAGQPQRTEAQKIRQVVEQNLMNGLSISDIAFLCNMSVSTFKRKFLHLYKTSPSKWMQQRRLEAAARLLQNKKDRPADIYLAVGYENHSSFSKAFKEYYGTPPKDYNGQPPLVKNDLLATGF